MRNYLRQPEIRQVLSPDVVAHPDHMKAGDEVEVTAIMPHGTDGDSTGWMASFHFNGVTGCCDPRNLSTHRPFLFPRKSQVAPCS